MKKKEKVLIGFCDRKKGIWRRKCYGEIIRIDENYKGLLFKHKIGEIDYCVKCKAIHMIWKKGELKEILNKLKI